MKTWRIDTDHEHLEPNNVKPRPLPSNLRFYHTTELYFTYHLSPIHYPFLATPVPSPSSGHIPLGLGFGSFDLSVVDSNSNARAEERSRRFTQVKLG